MFTPEDQRVVTELCRKYGSGALDDAVVVAKMVVSSDRKQALFDLLVRKGYDPDMAQEALDKL